MRCLFIVDPLDRLQLLGDTSYALMLEAAARGWSVWTCQIEHLGLIGNDAVTEACPTIVMPGTTPSEAFQIEASSPQRLGDFDVVLMRR
ncbi:MAG: glutathione synthase, partial [Polyangiales bacterium]